MRCEGDYDMEREEAVMAWIRLTELMNTTETPSEESVARRVVDSGGSTSEI
jgi:hypothetical protein